MRRAARALIVALATCIGAALLGIAASLVWSAPRPVSANAIDGVAFEPHPGAVLPLDTRLLDEQGRDVSLGELFGATPVLLVLHYLRCTSLCGVTLRNIVSSTLAGAPLQAGRDYRLVAISIDPRDKPADSAEAHARYAALLHSRSGAGLHFLTGSEESVRRIADRVGFHYRYDQLLDACIHPAGFVVVTPGGAISRYVEGVAIEP